jgi:2-succinyl-6-hydroxy-2,4-cyclohexadiene-1-carboxylate synthase
MLHGFGGTRRAWDGVSARLDPERYLPLALDLPGHGQASSQPGPITFESCVAAVLDASPKRFALCGYSLGGRIALHVALAAPERISRLVLVSCSPGIEDDGERAERRLADIGLADELERVPFEQFIDKWRSQPLFADDPPKVAALARADQRRNDPHALAKIMRGIGTGEMQPLWARLGELAMRGTVVVGERDAKFCALGERMVALMPEARLAVIPGGHVLPLENPRELARVISVDRGRFVVPDDFDDPLPDDLLDEFER